MPPLFVKATTVLSSFGCLEHQAGQPVARDSAAAVADGCTAGDALVGNAEDLGHVALHRIPGGVADGENGRVKLRVALGVIEVLGVVAAGSVHHSSGSRP